MRTGVQAIVFLLMPIASHAAGSCESLPRCREPAPLTFSCATRLPEANTSSPTTAQIEACQGELRGCVRELLGDGFVNLTSATSGAVLRLNGNQAEGITDMVERAKRAGSRMTDVSIASDPRLTRMTAALSAEALAGSVGGAASHQATWKLLHELGAAVSACHSVSRAVSSASAPDVAAIERSLLCAFRSGNGLAFGPVYERWPGCPCDNGRGRTLQGACVTSRLADPFHQIPVDSRLPDRLGRFLETLHSRVAPYVPVSVELLGCTEIRLQMGPNVTSLGQHPERGLQSRDISDHAMGTACDIGAITLRAPDCTTRRLDLKELRGALERYGHRARHQDWQAFRRANKGLARENALFRELARTPGDDPDSWQLRLGGMAQDALVESGFRAYSPLTNSAHDDHFHVELR